MSNEPPGPARLFTVAPIGAAALQVIATDPYRVVLHTDQLAAAAISAAAEAARRDDVVWITSPDRWHASVTATGDGWQINGSTQAPVDAIGRALNHITQHQGATS